MNAASERYQELADDGTLEMFVEGMNVAMSQLPEDVFNVTSWDGNRLTDRRPGADETVYRAQECEKISMLQRDERRLPGGLIMAEMFKLDLGFVHGTRCTERPLLLARLCQRSEPVNTLLSRREKTAETDLLSIDADGAVNLLTVRTKVDVKRDGFGYDEEERTRRTVRVLTSPEEMVASFEDVFVGGLLLQASSTIVR